MISKEKLKQQRKVQGLTQEELSQVSGISIRTIQRLEKGLSPGSPHTLKTLAAALDLNNTDLIKDKELVSLDPSPQLQSLKKINLSVLSGLLLPLGNLVFPALVFRNHRHVSIESEAKKILSFQLIWTLCTLLFIFLLAPIMQFFFEPLTGGGIPIPVVAYFFAVAINVFLTIQTAFKLDKGVPILTFIPNLF